MLSIKKNQRLKQGLQLEHPVSQKRSVSEKNLYEVFSIFPFKEIRIKFWRINTASDTDIYRVFLRKVRNILIVFTNLEIKHLDVNKFEKIRWKSSH